MQAISAVVRYCISTLYSYIRIKSSFYSSIRINHLFKTLDFILGEKRRVYLEISSIDLQNFTIHDATFKLSLKDALEEEGNCRIDDHVISVLIQPQHRGGYILSFEYDIGDEIYKEDVLVKVK